MLATGGNTNNDSSGTTPVASTSIQQRSTPSLAIATSGMGTESGANMLSNGENTATPPSSAAGPDDQLPTYSTGAFLGGLTSASAVSSASFDPMAHYQSATAGGPYAASQAYGYPTSGAFDICKLQSLSYL